LREAIEALRGPLGDRSWSPRGDRTDLRVLQKLLSTQATRAINTQEREAVELLFAEVLVWELGFEWALLEEPAAPGRLRRVLSYDGGRRMLMFPLLGSTAVSPPHLESIFRLLGTLEKSERCRGARRMDGTLVYVRDRGL
jgi:hypothetical protein